MATVKVVVHGAFGKVGSEVLKALCAEPGMEPVGAVEIRATEDYLSLPDGSGLIPISSDLSDILARCRPQVVVDFTNAEGAMAALRTATASKVNVVTGSTGLSESNIKEAEDLAQEHKVGVVIAPNFALGAVLLIQMARQLAPFFDYAEVYEMHHETKIDAPSGTSLAIARAIAEGKGGPLKAPKAERETLPGTRGGEYQGVVIHSTRMPGLMAHHEVVFGAQGQTLSLRHDTIGRECYMPGVMLAVRQVMKSKGLIFGLDSIVSIQGVPDAEL
ncbi:MAG: 4-hydroxy-tetrahydrodipicolinate reductase [Chloroflexi bacterium]|nr:4-hydroxy-tetrahydrodipicolinate reductase [Chloroflexota bacterium]